MMNARSKPTSNPTINPPETSSQNQTEQSPGTATENRSENPTENQIEQLPETRNEMSNEIPRAAATEKSTLNQLFRNAGFTRLLIGYFLSGLGDQLYNVAVPLMVYDLTRSSLAAGWTTATEFLPTAVFGLFIGVLLDRWSRKTVMTIGLLLQGVLITGLPALILGLHTPVYIVYLLCFLMSVLSLGVMTGYEAVLPSLVPKHQFVTATGLVSYAFSITRMVGPALAGVLIGLVGYAASFSADGLSFIVYALLLIGVSISQPKAVHKRSVSHDFSQGLRFVSGDPVLRPLVAGFLLANIGISAAVPIYLFSLRDVLHLGPGLIGVVLAIGSVGGMAGNTLYVRLQSKIVLGHQMMMTGVVITLGYLTMVFWVNHWIGFSLGYCLVSGGSVWALGNFRYISQTRSPDVLRGRTAGMAMTLTRVFAPVMAVAGGALAALWGTAAVYTFAAFGMGLSMIVSWRGGLWAIRSVEVAAVPEAMHSAQPPTNL